jgi:hypothetical protein
MYAIIQELLEEQEKQNFTSRPILVRHWGNGVVSSSSMNGSIDSKSSGMLSTATPFCIFHDDNTIVTATVVQQCFTTTTTDRPSDSRANCHDLCATVDQLLSSSSSTTTKLVATLPPQAEQPNDLTEDENCSERNEEEGCYRNSDVWNINWTEMNDDTDCSKHNGSILKGTNFQHHHQLLVIRNKKTKQHAPPSQRSLKTSSCAASSPPIDATELKNGPIEFVILGDDCGRSKQSQRHTSKEAWLEEEFEFPWQSYIDALERSKSRKVIGNKTTYNLVEL